MTNDEWTDDDTPTEYQLERTVSQLREDKTKLLQSIDKYNTVLVLVKQLRDQGAFRCCGFNETPDPGRDRWSCYRCGQVYDTSTRTNGAEISKLINQLIDIMDGKL